MINGLQDLVYLVWFALLMNPAGTQLADLVDTRAFWKEAGVEWNAPALRNELAQAQAPADPDVQGAIHALGAATHAERQHAAERVRKAGAAALPLLQAAARSDDPEIQSRAKALLRDWQGTSLAQPARRLMAIRALAELGDVSAVPLLEAITSTATAFEQEAAREALRVLKGLPPSPPEPGGRPARAVEAALWQLPSRVDIAGRLRVPDRICPTPLTGRFVQQGFLVEMAGQKKLVENLRQHATRVLGEIGNVRIHGVAFAVDGVVWPQRKVAAVVAGDFDIPLVRKALATHGQLALRRGNLIWYRLKEGLHLAMGEDGLLRADLSPQPSFAWWKPCSSPLMEGGALPFCWPQALKDAATAAAHGTNHFWMATGGENGRIWRNRPVFEAIQGAVIQGQAVGTNTGWRFQVDLPCGEAKPTADLHANLVEKLGDLKKAATAAAVNLTAIRPLADLLTSVALPAPSPDLRINAELADPDNTLLALPFLLMLQAGFGF